MEHELFTAYSRYLLESKEEILFNVCRAFSVYSSLRSKDLSNVTVTDGDPHIC